MCIISMLAFKKAYSDFEFIRNKEQGCLSSRFLACLQSTFQADVFFETGTHNGESTTAAIPYFKEIITAELHEGYALAAKNNFSRFKQVHTYQGRSPEIIRTIAPTLSGNILFWLDAHDSGGADTILTNDEVSDPNAVTAIRNELIAIRDIGISDCVILIDDIRAFGTIISNCEYMGSWAYPSMQELKKLLLDINPNFALALLGDILIAYDKNKYQPELSEVVKACTKTRFYDGNNLTDSELIALEKIIMTAPPREAQFIRQLYFMTNEWKEALFIHDLWYGLVELGCGNYTNAHNSFLMTKHRTQYLNKVGKPENKVITYNHPRIDMYIQECLNRLQGHSRE